MTERIRARDALVDALAADELADQVADAAVFETRSVSDEWEHVRSELSALFHHSRDAARAAVPVVYVVSSDALLGRSGTGNAMVATGALSAARTLAAEMRKSDVAVNVVGVAEDTPIPALARWIANLASGGAGGPTGELIQLGGTQIGKALS